MPGKPINRCPWPGIEHAEYARYHDEEWGVPHADSQRMFEKLILEGFQAGLSWLTILRKRESFRRAFHGFDASRMARYTARDVERLMGDAGIVRNRLKIEAAIDNAKAFLALDGGKGLSPMVWSAVGGKPIINRHRSFNEIPAATPASRELSRTLKQAGFRFVGETTVYAFMQSTGLVNDHIVGCHRHEPCARLQRSFRP